MSSAYFPLFFPDAQASSEVVLTSEQIKAFHQIDRALFSRFVFVLNREMNQSFEVFCFLYMLEQAGYARDLINYLVSTPDDFINSLANEIVVCLNFLYNNAFSTAFFVANSNDDHNSVIPVIVQLTGGKITLRFIHQNRDVLLQDLKKNMTHTCRRALADLLVRPQPDLYNKEKPLALEAEKTFEEMGKLSLTTPAQKGSTSRSSVRQETTIRPIGRPETTIRPIGRPETTLRAPIVRQETTIRPIGRPETTLRAPTVRQETTLRAPTVRQETTLRAPIVRQETTLRAPTVRQETTYRPIGRPETTYRPVVRQEATYRPVIRQEATYRPIYRQETIYRPVVRKVTITSPPTVEEEAEETTAEAATTNEEEVAMMLAADDRTVFLTFSKGYPISEEEVRVYFTKRFGEVIEAVVMQDVDIHGQSLFAKMVLKMSHVAKMEDIVTPRSRNKFTINGKHVWARKYIAKISPSASSSSQI